MIVWAILAIIFGIYDLQISQTLANESSPLGEFGRDYGELPGFGLIAICIIICVGYFFDNPKYRRTIGIIGILAGIVIICLGFLLHDTPLILIGGTVSVSIAVLLILTPQIQWKIYNKLAHMVLYLAFIVPLLFVQTVKVLSGRVRYNDLLPDHSNYSPWYIFNGLDIHNSSFPSGHTTMAWMFLPVLIFLWNGNFDKGVKLLASIMIIGWGAFVLTSRVIIGEHYASDVLFSTGMVVMVTYLLYKLYYRKQQ
ncbi:MAG: phosphatase PAP2 family protein [Candidatus Thermoplasmatota archaeon]|nr:phosphatase PAP2 family protein [Candidatus Thermoplasmatota archaeon]MBU4071931.1 phosphatase PAP2 family protein [Candidatus Thermoplasmatota archaeon]MBU4145230.1 phosphatase PAP2 family protein [Candidatus Thermoplasmatota archaeon]MBU4592281.1 phosphatase PAP2 family protein [Candidatus Thermoplasmatota archaeon]